MRIAPGVTLQQLLTSTTNVAVGNKLETSNKSAGFATLILGRPLFLPMLVSN